MNQFSYRLRTRHSFIPNWRKHVRWCQRNVIQQLDVCNVRHSYSYCRILKCIVGSCYKFYFSKSCKLKEEIFVQKYFNRIQIIIIDDVENLTMTMMSYGPSNAPYPEMNATNNATCGTSYWASDAENTIFVSVGLGYPVVYNVYLGDLPYFNHTMDNDTLQNTTMIIDGYNVCCIFINDLLYMYSQDITRFSHSGHDNTKYNTICRCSQWPWRQWDGIASPNTTHKHTNFQHNVYVICHVPRYSVWSESQ